MFDVEGKLPFGVNVSCLTRITPQPNALALFPSIGLQTGCGALWRVLDIYP
jgi:hypothetical protein